MLTVRIGGSTINNLMFAAVIMMTSAWATMAQSTVKPTLDCLFTKDKVVPLVAAGSAIHLGDTFDETEFAKKMPGYVFRSESQEGELVWVAFRPGSHGSEEMGIGFVVDNQDRIYAAFGSWYERNVIDAVGMQNGSRLSDAFTSDAFCTRDYSELNGIGYWCMSEHSIHVTYWTDPSDCSEKDLASTHLFREERWTMSARIVPPDCLRIQNISLGNFLW